jgi:hypothetical protein
VAIAYYGHDETGALACLVPADGLADVGGYDGAGDADDHGDPDAAGVFAGHHEFCDCADYEADDEFPEQAEHWRPP